MDIIRGLVLLIIILVLVWLFKGTIDGEHVDDYIVKHGLKPTIDRMWDGPQQRK